MGLSGHLFGPNGLLLGPSGLLMGQVKTKCHSNFQLHILFSHCDNISN